MSDYSRAAGAYWAALVLGGAAALGWGVYHCLTFSLTEWAQLVVRSEEHTSELQSHRDLHSFPTRRSSDLGGLLGRAGVGGRRGARVGRLPLPDVQPDGVGAVGRPREPRRHLGDAARARPRHEG